MARIERRQGHGIGRIACAAAAAMLLLLGASRAEAAVVDQVCGGIGSSRATLFPSEAELRLAAGLAEQRLAAGDAQSVEEAVAALHRPATVAQRPPARAVALYCAAAGEAMRRSANGSQAQAQTYLAAAFRAASEAGERQLSSRAAYRLGLVSLAAPGAANTRSGGSGAPARQAEAAPAQQGDSCAALATRNLQTASSAFISRTALQCAAASGDPALSGLASLRLARFQLALSRSPAADAPRMRRAGLEAALAGIPVVGRIDAPDLRAELIGRLVETAIELGGADPGLLTASVAIMRRSSGPAAQAYAAALDARLALAAGQPRRAQGLVEQALVLESQRPLPARLPGLYLILAEADPANRERHVFAAYTALGNLRPLLPRLDPVTEESTFSLYMREVFEHAVDVELAGAVGESASARVASAQQIVEAYRQAELQSAVGSECIPPRDAVRPQDLAAGEILLYPLLLHDRIELLYVSGSDRAGGAPVYRRLPPNRSADRREVARLVEAMVLSTTYGEDEDWRGPARRLYELLIAPIEDRLQPGSVLAIIPDGPLRALPFAALLDGEGRFLVERTRIAVAPALAYLQPGEVRGNAPVQIVAASLRRQVTLPAGFFPELQSTAAEASIAAENGAPGRHIENFRRADLVQAMAGGGVDVLHLATHASFNGRSDRSFIVADGEVIRLAELRDIIAANRRRGAALDLLVLSACETAVGDDEASMGLAGAAVQAGAVSAIASLWQVDDGGTGQLMRQFYSGYGRGASRSAALRDAQLAMIRGGGANARPHIWAAFMLLGAWR